MAPEQHHGDNLQILAESAPLPSSHIANGFGASCAKNAMMFDLPKVCCCQSVMDDGLLPRRKSASRPRLPCFKGLGISTIDQASAEDGQTQAAGYPGLQGRSFEQSSAGRAASGSTPLLTPPEELDSLKWPSSTRASSVLAKSRSHTNIEPSIGRAASKVEIASLSERGPPSEGISLATSGSGGSNSHQGAAVVDTTPSSPESGESTSCLDQSVAAAVMSIDPSNPFFSTIQIVSQTLPNPAHETARPNAIFTQVVTAIQARFGTNRQPYITITHAVPPRFDLLNLPSSPPSTPNLFTGRDDYFTQSIFAHAAVVPSYHVTNSNLATPAPSSPNPIVPPASVQISVLERYIPPPSPQECRELFSLNGQSVLIDRLTELSPKKGSMLFVYPTKRGASTFTSRYLSRILDPLLRALVEVHQLSYGLAESLSNMSAVADMYEFEALKAKLSSLCRQMTNRISTSDLHRSHFSLVYASAAEVAIDRKTWTEWYLKQEHARFKRTLETYWGRGKRLSQLESASAGTVLREFIDGVNKMTVDEAGEMGPGIEVGVFVIRRTLAGSAD